MVEQRRQLAGINVAIMTKQVSMGVKETPFAELERIAVKGNVEAMTELGERWLDGRDGARANPEAGLSWLRNAATPRKDETDFDRVDAQFRLGKRLIEGKGVPQDNAEGARFLRLAADNGADSHLGYDVYFDLAESLLADPPGSPRAAAGLYMVEKSSDLENSYGLMLRGELLLDGKHLIKDVAEGLACRWDGARLMDGDSNHNQRLWVAEEFVEHRAFAHPKSGTVLTFLTALADSGDSEGIRVLTLWDTASKSAGEHLGTHIGQHVGAGDGATEE